MTFQLPMFISSGVPVFCVLVPEQCRTSSSHSLGTSMELSLRVQLSYTIFEMRQKIDRSGMTKKL